MMWPRGQSRSRWRGRHREAQVRSSSPVTALGGHTFQAAAPSQTFDVTASETAVAVSESYTLATGAMAITISGLPPASNAAVLVTGPSGFSQSVTATTTLIALPGAYLIGANDVATAGLNYTASPPQQTITITPSL